jgi:signal peptidase I
MNEFLAWFVSNFPLVLFILTIGTGIIWFLDRFYLSKKRRALAEVTLRELDLRNERMREQGIEPDLLARQEVEKRLLKQPMWVEYSGSFFPIIALVFFVRSFLYEPFKIPSSSMVPTLLVGDLILVNKYTYGVRLPIINQKIIEIGRPDRGDVVVFKYPIDPTIDYIKRVVGVPGDKISYKNKKLTINGNPVVYRELPDYLDEQSLTYSKHYSEALTTKGHGILNFESSPTFVVNQEDFIGCEYDVEGFDCVVPEGSYFMMGDNRDNSKDSRYWGFVPDKYLVGKAFFVWMNFGNLKRIGGFD